MNKFSNSIHMLKSVTNIQMNSFVITTSDGKLIVVDGGQRANALYLLDYLKELTGDTVPHIDAWFLTHAHDDHVDAFLEIMQNHKDEITLERVFMNIPSVQFFEQGDEPDKGAAVTAGELYTALPLYADKLCVVTEGDIYNIGDASFEILYSPYPDILANICNNSSIVFKMTLGEKTALFLSDCGVEAGDVILNKYGESDILNCDICQMSHHGQNGVTKVFYSAVKPEICLWCTPDWLWDNDMGKGFNTHFFKTVEVRKWMEEIRVKKNYVMMNGTQICPL